MIRNAHGWSAIRWGIHAWVLLTLVATLFLLCSGGIVTSMGVGMSVPDWPNTYGYNMFLFPISRWVGGVFYEHSHRLIASGVGLMTLIMGGLMFYKEPRRWVKILGAVAIGAVCLQGLLGGLRVTLYMDEIGIFHGLLAQAFFCLMGILAIVTSRRFVMGNWDSFHPDPVLRNAVVMTTLLVFFQLAVGATMRHEHAGLAISDFPTAYGRLLPDTSPDAITAINEVRINDGGVPTSAVQIWIHMLHRGMAIILFLSAILCAVRANLRPNPRSTKIATTAWALLFVGQIVLGIWTILSNKAAEIATAHMALGALILLAGVVLSFRLVRGGQVSRFSTPHVQPRNPEYLAA